MMQTTSISDVNWYYYKWVKNRSRFRSSKSICAGRGKIAVALLSGSSTACSGLAEFRSWQNQP
jgi:hypothetical protein